jgi:hypothetical protein
MHPALRLFALLLAAVSISHFYSISAVAQGPATTRSLPVSSLRFASDRVSDPSGDELKSFGPQGVIIEQARADVVSILAAENACSAWFRAAEPQAAEKFRSLRFAVDPSGKSEITKLDPWQISAVFYQPYVARTGQNVGWGSTITLNANGAFFNDWAPVRVIANSQDKGYLKSFRRLAVANFGGATREARILTLLHELGHVLDMLPIDSGVPSGPELSTNNTELVLRHCSPQIREAAKHSLSRDPSFFLTESPLALNEERARRGTDKQ